jgi:hypothetical protein
LLGATKNLVAASLDVRSRGSRGVIGVSREGRTAQGQPAPLRLGIFASVVTVIRRLC